MGLRCYQRDMQKLKQSLEVTHSFHANGLSVNPITHRPAGFKHPRSERHVGHYPNGFLWLLWGKKAAEDNGVNHTASEYVPSLVSARLLESISLILGVLVTLIKFLRWPTDR